MTRPRLWDATDAVAWVARDILRNRQQGYPGAVEGGKLDPIAAETGLRVAAAIAADWTAAIELSPHFDDSPYVIKMADQLVQLDRAARATSAERIDTLAAALRHPNVAGNADYAELVEALLWWERAGDNGLATRKQLNGINADLRARVPERKAA